MIERAWGNVNGQTIFFDRVTGDEWKATVPRTNDGEYVVELLAEDGAGNTTYFCTMLLVIRGHELQGTIVPRGFSITDDSNEYKGLPTIKEFLGNIKGLQFNGNVSKKEYQAEVQKGGYTIERTICGRNEH